ncbi:proline-rich extensin-like protein EPR1 [Cyclopterus lumpus]|uniref:proline-rich extensin-like protein EPR1 n=1 Tax=Cyclopterus lumpus TaxID=8103 RepID=UPI001485DBE1|nr:proline-rich extensin-like protein EPR1 [Cyclopterus lumpus]
MTFPYGLKSLVESISRAVLLAEPANIPDFLSNYMTELISFRSCHAGTDPKLVSFDFEEFWEKDFLKIKEIPVAKSPQVPSPIEIDEALTPLYSEMASSVLDVKVTITPSRGPTVTPSVVLPPIQVKKTRGSLVSGRDEPKKGGIKARIPPLSFKAPITPSRGPTVTPTLVLPPIQVKKTRGSLVSGRDEPKKGGIKARIPPLSFKAPITPSRGPTVTPTLVLPPIQVKKTRGSLVSGRDEPKKGGIKARIPPLSFKAPITPSRSPTVTPTLVLPPIQVKKTRGSLVSGRDEPKKGGIKARIPSLSFNAPITPSRGSTVTPTLVLPPIQVKKTRGSLVSGRDEPKKGSLKARIPSLSFNAPITPSRGSTVTPTLVLPPIQVKKTRGSLVSGMDEPKKGGIKARIPSLSFNAPITPSRGSTVTPTLVLPPIQVKKTRGSLVSGRNEPKKAPVFHLPPCRFPNVTVPIQQQDKDPLAKWNDRPISPDKPNRLRFPAIVTKGTNDLNQAHTSFSNPPCPQLAHAIHIIAYKRVQIRSLYLDHGT